MNRIWSSRLSFFASHTTRRSPISCSYATESDPHQFPKEGFGAPIWKKTLGVVLLGFVWYQADRYFIKEGEKHPITKLIEYSMVPESEYKRRSLEHIDLIADAAKEKILFEEAQWPPIYRFRDPDQFERASPHCIEPGTEVDLSDLVVRQD